MIEHVFKHSRLVDGERVVARCYTGRFRLHGEKQVRTVALNTPDRRIALKRLRDYVVELEREREGMIAPRVMRETAERPLLTLVGEYEAHLRGQEREARHVHDTTQRLRRIIQEIGWNALADVRADAFAKWRTGLKCSPKTRKEYQVSACAFLNWLVKGKRLAENPLAKLPQPDQDDKHSRWRRGGKW